MINIYQLVTAGPFVSLAYTGTPVSTSATQVILKQLEPGKEVILQRQNVQPVGGSFLVANAAAGIPLVLAVAFTTPDGKETEGSNVVSITP